ncbi:alpha-L-fucosidase [Arachidicoccus rhizosphaerae]|uniref:alpha-L-fucosidase n=1 Tax=Arachidicoccus rhizosphaerae TaxID=551991 RepID=A0A1H4BDH1_9BACT|nr:alpha-L-fucosidase [Arachidicoccus rhizosphaerae]SEA46157.1 alpha-L-fucosidase [Arachidicoccus rhizosphaerae]
MQKKNIPCILIAFLLTVSFISRAQNTTKQLFNETAQQKSHRLQWWTDARFGMFIHWGLYSEAARHEWVKNRERLTTQQYQKYFDNFDPDHFEPKKWAKEAKAAGMKYAVLTTKHHEGFCLFDSKYTDYKATNTPAHRDLVREFVDAFRAEGIKVGFYYSLLDWHYPDYTIDRNHPQRIDNGDSLAYAKINQGRDMEKYRKYLFNQVRELLTNYGKIDILWLDFSFPGKNGKGHQDWHSKELLKMIRQLQPEIIVDNRLDLNDYSDGYDFETPEQVSAQTLAKYRGKVWETCQTFSGSWGYYRDETSWKTNHQLLDLLISSVSNGGNLILNVGPTARGEFDYRAVSHLDSIAYWMHANNRAIYGCTFAPDSYQVPDGTKLTYNPTTKRLYICLYDIPENGKLKLTGYTGKIKYAQLLNDASELTYTQQGQDLILNMPKVRPPYDIPVVELFLQ